MTDDIPAQPISIRQAQDLVDALIRTTGVRYFSELSNMAILTEEVGEVARLMSRLYGDQSFKESDKGRELSDELADVLWVLLCIANQTGIDVLAVQDASEIFLRIRTFATRLFDEVAARRDLAVIDIAYHRTIRFRIREKRCEIGAAAATRSNQRDANAVVGISACPGGA